LSYEDHIAVGIVPEQPAFAVASYSALLLASLEPFGAGRGKAYADLPKWRRRAARRLPANVPTGAEAVQASIGSSPFRQSTTLR